jgi:two-component system LytT family sensor kinase
MQHPILKNLKSALIYSAFWIVLIIFDFSTFYNNHHLDLQNSLVTSFIFGFLFACMGIAIWYVVLYSFPEKVSIPSLIINHITAAAAIIFLWIICSLFFIQILINDTFYQFIVNNVFFYILVGFIFYSLYVLIYYLIIYNHNLKERKKNEDRLLAMVKEAELNLLKSQINPHFLFNSLNSISSLTITNPSQAQEMIIKLSDFLRYSISRDSKQQSTLKFELENIERYLDIEKIRFGLRLNYQPTIEKESESCLLPIMILQPLFENAIKHGVYESTEPITVQVHSSFENGYLSINLTNNFDPEAPSKKGAGIGLKNIRERLRLIYHREGLLQTIVTENKFEVKLLFPQTNYTQA